jgi:hypothetical protein
MLVMEKMAEISKKINQTSKKCYYSEHYENLEELKAFEDMISIFEELKDLKEIHKYVSISYNWENFNLMVKPCSSFKEFTFWNLEIHFTKFQLAKFSKIEISNINITEEDFEKLQLEKFKELSVTEVLLLVIKKMESILEFKRNFQNFLKSEVK